MHQQERKLCRYGSSYLYPLEAFAWLALYAASIFVLSRNMGNFHVATIVITSVGFSQIDQRKHDLWEPDRFPFGYLSHMSRMLSAACPPSAATSLSVNRPCAPGQDARAAAGAV